MAAIDVVCLRPEQDFLKIGVEPPKSLSITYMAPDDPALADRLSVASAVVIPAVGPKLPGSLFDGSKVRLVQVTGAGVDRLDADAMKALGIAVANVPGGSSAAIAEYAVASALTLMRRSFWADGELRNGRYAEARADMMAASLNGLEGMTVGVVGLGVIGMAVARAFHGMGSQIVYHDPAPRDPQQVAEIEARSLSLADLLACSDVVTLHVPLLPATESLISAARLGQMKQGAVLINAARGGIVDEAALVDSLAAGHLGGAAVDVFSTEPPGADNPLLQNAGTLGRRILLTPHIAGVTRQSWVYLFRSAWQNVERLLIAGEPPANRVY